ncbi:hypothetical protein SAMN02745168_1233 [Papillibacter cinnamivorans DSM 12816]|uniref:Uncharacterized protein n=1 Tax=Papillibacter cinnamivorans DSM 12816 TaxID=1122930 RepID=A0A1W1ZMA5_9FIRM|nr:hypothetical protein SAMN02745168_1233 [Papillibacter cinnamivorans DSM 12816]
MPFNKKSVGANFAPTLSLSKSPIVLFAVGEKLLWISCCVP